MKKKLLQTIIWIIAAFIVPITAVGQVCQIGSTTYATLDAALAAVTNGQTITLLSDITYTSPIDLGDKSITFNLGNNFYTLTLDVSATPGSAAITTAGNLTFAGSGFFNATAADIGIHLSGTTGSQTLAFNHSAASTTIETTGTGANTAGIVSDNPLTYITGYSSLRILSSGTDGDGIRLTAASASITMTGTGSLGLDILAYGAGEGHGLNFTAAGNHTVNINLSEQYLDGSIFYGGDNGNGLNYQGETGTLTVSKNNGNGTCEFRGVNGIYTKANLSLANYSSYNNSEIILRGISGIKMDNTDKTLANNGSRIITILGGSYGLWLAGNTTITGSLSPQGNSYGIYVDAGEATLTFTNTAQSSIRPSVTDVSSNGYGIYAAGALTLKQTGSYLVNITATGGNAGEGIFVGSGKDLSLSGNLTVESDGGAGAKGLALSGAGKVNFTDARQKLTVNNNSAAEEAIPCLRTGVLSLPYWTTTGDVDIASGDDDANENVTFVLPASTGTTKTAAIFFSNGIPVISTSGALPFGIVGTPYSQKLSGTNNITAWTVTSGTLPDGLTLDNTGLISGTPTVAAYSSFQVTASGNHGTSAPVTSGISTQDFVAVSDIQLNGLPSTGMDMLPMYLYAMTTPYDATFQNVVWSVTSAGTTGASITFDGYNYFLNAATPGKVTIRATIANGLAIGEDYTKDFIISVTDIVCEMVGGPLDGKQYKDLQTAIGDAPYDKTPAVIRLLDDIFSQRMNLNNNVITFDLNGHDLTQFGGGESGLSLNDSQVDFTGTGNFKGIDDNGGFVISLNGNSSCAMTGIEINASATGVSCNNYNIDNSVENFTGDIILNAAYSTGIQISDRIDFTFNGNITASKDNCTGISVYGSSLVTVNGKIDADLYIIINGITKTPADKETVSGKPGYDEYTDGVSTVWVKQTELIPNVLTWKGGSNSDWDDESNWQGGQIPAETDIVYIPGSASHFPLLNKETLVSEIHFEPGAQIGGQSNLTAKAFVQYDLRTTNRWLMLSMPLKEAYPGDFTFGGYPVTWVRTFETRESTTGEGSMTKGVWITSLGNTNAFTLGDGFVVWLNDDNSTVDKGLKLLGGIRELPFFYHQAEGSPDKELYDKVHQAHDYDSETQKSTFYAVTLTGGEYVRNTATHYSVDRSDNACLLVKEPFSKVLDFGTNAEANGEMALVGNPYMAALNFEALHDANPGAIKPCYQIWTGNGYETYTGYGYAGNIDPESNTLTQWISPLQAFLVEKPENPQSGSLDFNESMATVNTGVTFRSSADSENKLDIIAKNPKGEVLTFIAKRDGGQDTFGDSDARKIMNDISDLPEVYTLKPYKSGSIATAVNIVNSDDLLIPIGFATSYTGNITFSFNGMDRYDANLSLVDVETGRTIDLTGLTSYDYVVNYTPKQANGETSACEDRFFIRISKTITGLRETIAEKVNVYEANDHIQVVSSASDPIKEVSIYNLQGALMYKESSINAISYMVNGPWNSGVYIVKVYTAQGVTVRKIVKN